MIDIVRCIAVLLYLVLVVQILRIAGHYYQSRKVLPHLPGAIASHVYLNGIGVAGIATVAVYQNISRFGEPFTWYLPLNLALFLYLNWSIYSIGHYENRWYIKTLKKKNKQTR